ncbi:addiction module toxin, HicA family protein [Rubrobacter xylanophilus]|uniref:Addiction module toxin, HicA family protein n=1 Tax=Rubrobacter xylanophilus TaxID=49319 RepID=A0A510HK89_9ACTN|nr:type II toxin-antitoxin system HicA family toxin [Rubrobacter xylanophilus]BBL78757.1 addiction module toxin, HicA family protein [Rubrobacter xylanophilus]
MKRRALIDHIKAHGGEFYREGGRHTIYIHRENGRSAAVPRHTEIANNLARKICRDLGIEPP